MWGKLSQSIARVRLHGLAAHLVALRQYLTNKTLSALYGAAVSVGPKGQVGVAAAVVLWFMQDGFKHYMMIKNTSGAEQRARFVSVFGLTGQAHMGAAAKLAINHALGPVLAKTIADNVLAPDRVAAAPVFYATDEATGAMLPVQALVWCVQVQPAQAELVQAGKGLTMVLVPEFGIKSSQISPTHRGLLQAVSRHLPKNKDLLEAATAGKVEDKLPEIVSAPRVLH
jgi:hypothetical protein